MNKSKPITSKTYKFVSKKEYLKIYKDVKTQTRLYCLGQKKELVVEMKKLLLKRQLNKEKEQVIEGAQVFVDIAEILLSQMKENFLYNINENLKEGKFEGREELAEIFRIGINN